MDNFLLEKADIPFIAFVVKWSKMVILTRVKPTKPPTSVALIDVLNVVPPNSSGLFCINILLPNIMKPKGPGSVNE